MTKHKKYPIISAVPSKRWDIKEYFRDLILKGSRRFFEQAPMLRMPVMHGSKYWKTWMHLYIGVLV